MMKLSLHLVIINLLVQLNCSGAAFYVGPSTSFASDESSGFPVGEMTYRPSQTQHKIDNYYIPYKRKWLIFRQWRDQIGNNLKMFAMNLLVSIAKRTSYANTPEEVKEIDMHTETDFLWENVQKRSNQKEYHSGGCEASKAWKSLGSDHFPRFIKSYNCTSATCDRSFGECRPKFYSVKVLKKKESETENISMNVEQCDPHLPEQLRCDWKFVSVNVTTYCECYSVSLAPFSG